MLVVVGDVVVVVSALESTASSPTRSAMGAATPMATTVETATAARARLMRFNADARVVEGGVPGITRRVCPE